MDDSNQNGQSKRKGGTSHHKADCSCVVCRTRHASTPAISAAKPAKKFGILPRERKFAKEVAKQYVTEGEVNLTDAAISAGYTPSTAARSAGNILARDRVRDSVLRELEKKGVTDSKLAKVLRRGLDAYEVKRIVKDGQVIEEHNDPDFHAQHKYLDTAYKLKGAFPKEEAEVTGATFHLHTLRVLTPGHLPGCPCESCRKVRNEMAEKLREYSKVIPPEFRVVDVSEVTDSDDRDSEE